MAKKKEKKKMKKKICAAVSNLKKRQREKKLFQAIIQMGAVFDSILVCLPVTNLYGR